jgi:glutamine amidotransferase
MKVTLIDYGAGNVTSVERALRRLGAGVDTTNHPEEIAGADCLILPGVGHCGALLAAIDAHGLREALLHAIERGTPFLGICLGMQALYQASDEAPALAGFSLLSGRVTHLPDSVKLPHMGWNQLQILRPGRLLQGIPTEAYFYFAHSYAAPWDRAENVALCNHGREFAAVLERDNIFGVQFHPEKSGESGAKLLQNFLRIAA